MEKYSSSHMLNQLPCITLSSCTRFAAKIHKVVRVIITRTHNIVLGVVQKREELVIETGLAFGGELVPEAPHARAEDRPEIVHVLSRRHPICFINILPLRLGGTG